MVKNFFNIKITSVDESLKAHVLSKIAWSQNLPELHDSIPVTNQTLKTNEACYQCTTISNIYGFLCVNIVYVYILSSIYIPLSLSVLSLL